MPFLVTAAAAGMLVIMLAIVSGRSVPSSQTETKDVSNIILLEVPVSQEVQGSPLAWEGDTVLVKGKQFSSVQELGNILAEDRKGKSYPEAASPDTVHHIVVPVARNFSSIKELLEILREDRAKPTRDLVDGTLRNQSFVRGSDNSDYMLFFTS